MCPSERKIPELPEDSTRIFKRNMLDLYVDCPDSVFRNWRFSVLNWFCFAEFFRYYYIVSNNEKIKRKKENGYQPEEFKDEIVEFNHWVNSMYPKAILILASS